MIISLTLPTPPSTNQLYSGRRFKTAKYKSWITEAGWTAKAQWQGQITGPFILTIYLPRGMDIDNIKAIPDLLGPKCLNITIDDSNMTALHVYRHHGSECKIEIASTTR